MPQLGRLVQGKWMIYVLFAATGLVWSGLWKGLWKACLLFFSRLRATLCKDSQPATVLKFRPTLVIKNATVTTSGTWKSVWPDDWNCLVDQLLMGWLLAIGSFWTVGAGLDLGAFLAQDFVGNFCCFVYVEVSLFGSVLSSSTVRLLTIIRKYCHFTPTVFVILIRVDSLYCVIILCMKVITDYCLITRTEAEVK